jgi:hypothetical protein
MDSFDSGPVKKHWITLMLEDLEKQIRDRENARSETDNSSGRVE